MILRRRPQAPATTPAPAAPFGIDLSGATAELRADYRRPTLRPGPAPEARR